MARKYPVIKPGDTFGSWTVLSRTNTPPNVRKRFLCRCVCGVETDVIEHNLKIGHTISCGCLKLKDPVDTFFEKIHPEPNSGCWIWIGGLSDKKRGRHAYGNTQGKLGKGVPAHRFSYEIHYGKIKNNLHVCHKCDTPLCVNPAHLFLGTHKDNMLDCIKKGRHSFKNNFKKSRWENHIKSR